MEVFEQYGLINEKRWTEFLKSLEAGKEHTFTFPSIPDIKSCKTVAYEINSNRVGRTYSFDVNKGEKRVKISVKQS